MNQWLYIMGKHPWIVIGYYKGWYGVFFNGDRLDYSKFKDAIFVS